MRALGIVAEYNPFHNGHKYHIERSREQISADAVVCVMSGDFVQRGEPALLDKWTRSEMALRNGADVVIEIPTFFCLGDASVYARASVLMLEALGCVTHISFGSEAGDISMLRDLSRLLKDNSDEIAELSSSYTGEGLNWPRARQRAFEALFHTDPCFNEYCECLKGSNNVLALEYLENISTLEPMTLQRKGAGYDELYSAKHAFQSATGIRRMWMDGEDISRFVPPDVCGTLCSADQDQSLIAYREKEKRLFELVRYKLMISSPEDIAKAPQGGEGLENKLRSAARTCGDIDDLIMATKSKRYTYTRISRLIMQVLLDIDGSGSDKIEPKYLRVLGFTERGKQLIRNVKKDDLNTLPILTNINKETADKDPDFDRLLELDIKAADVYNLIVGKDIYRGSDHVRRPVML